eukprot:COSAG05_NODE_910_length_6641_cov_27.153776_10_plen_87_part_00
MADGNRHFEHKYFTIRERVALGEIALYWLSGKLNPADVTTKALAPCSVNMAKCLLEDERRNDDLRGGEVATHPGRGENFDYFERPI